MEDGDVEAFPEKTRNNRTCYILSRFHRESLQQQAAQAAAIAPGLVAHSVEYQGARLVLRNLHTQRRIQLCEGDVVVIASPVCFSPYLQEQVR